MYKPFISKALRYGPCVTTGSHSFTCQPHMNHTCLYSQPQGIVAVCLVLIASTREEMARLSWPGWLVTCGVKCPAPGIKPVHGHLSQYQLGPA